MFEEHLLGGLFVHFKEEAKYIKILQGNLELKIIFLQNTSLISVKQTEVC